MLTAWLTTCMPSNPGSFLTALAFDSKNRLIPFARLFHMGKDFDLESMLAPYPSSTSVCLLGLFSLSYLLTRSA